MDIERRNVIGASILAVDAGETVPLAKAGGIKLSSPAQCAEADSQVPFHKVAVDNFEVIYREASPADAPVLLLLHGFPTASHMFRDLIPHLADRYRVIAPDLPGFGQTFIPTGKFEYSFDNLAKEIEGFVDEIGLHRYAIYIFDYGAPTGLRLAMAHPDRVSAIIT